MQRAGLSSDLPEIRLKPIGTVRNQEQEIGGRDWSKVVSEIVLDQTLAPGLDGLSEFSHIIVLFWMHRVSDQSRTILKVHPQGRAELPLVGVFTTRSPSRPNPVGIAVVRLLDCRGNTLKVEGLDALDGTPVIDIKPFMPPRDLVGEVRVPDWVARLW